MQGEYPVPNLPGSQNDPGASIDNRLAEIAKMRKDNYDEFMKNEKVRAEERELLEAKQRLEQK